MKQKILTCLICLFSCVVLHAQEDTSYTYTLYRAINLYHARQYKLSAETFDRAFKLNKGGYNDDRYTAACSWALAGNKKAAFAQLMHIATKGNFTNIDRLMVDDDLESLHNDP